MSVSHTETAKDPIIGPKNQKLDVVKTVEETGEKENKVKRANKTKLKILDKTKPNILFITTEKYTLV